MQSQAEKERSDFEVEFKELGDMIKQQQIMLEQLRLKQFERTNEDAVVAATRTRVCWRHSVKRRSISTRRP